MNNEQDRDVVSWWTIQDDPQDVTIIVLQADDQSYECLVMKTQACMCKIKKTQQQQSCLDGCIKSSQAYWLPNFSLSYLSASNQLR